MIDLGFGAPRVAPRGGAEACKRHSRQFQARKPGRYSSTAACSCGRADCIVCGDGPGIYGHQKRGRATNEGLPEKKERPRKGPATPPPLPAAQLPVDMDAGPTAAPAPAPQVVAPEGAADPALAADETMSDAPATALAHVAPWAWKINKERCESSLETLLKSLEKQPFGYARALKSKGVHERRVPVYKDKPTTFGRPKGAILFADLLIDEEKCSRLHAELVVQEPRYVLLRNFGGSKDTTSLRGKYLLQDDESLLEDEDEFEICKKEFRFDAAPWVLRNRKEEEKKEDEQHIRNYNDELTDLRGNRAHRLTELYARGPEIVLEENNDDAERLRNAKYMGRNPWEVVVRLWVRLVLLNKERALALAQNHSMFKDTISRELGDLLDDSKLEPKAVSKMLKAFESKATKTASSCPYRSLYNKVWTAYEEYCIQPTGDAKNVLRERLEAACRDYDGADTVSERDQLSLPRRRRNVLRAGMDVESEADLDTDLDKVEADLRKAEVPDGVYEAPSPPRAELCTSTFTPSTRRLLDGVAAWVSRDDEIEPTRSRRRREMT